MCEVEIDPETGVVSILRYSAIDDVRRAVNPLILHGQTHGGVTQGIGQALWELCYYDPESGQPLATSFLDYAMPRAAETPEFTVGLSEVPAPLAISSAFVLAEKAERPALQRRWRMPSCTRLRRQG